MFTCKSSLCIHWCLYNKSLYLFIYLLMNKVHQVQTMASVVRLCSSPPRCVCMCVCVWGCGGGGRGGEVYKCYEYWR